MGKERKLIIKEAAWKDLENELEYLTENYSKTYALKFAVEFVDIVETIPVDYLHHPENRYLRTKNQVYRNIIWKKNYWIVYKIKPNTLEVLSLFHTKRNPKIIKKVKRIR
ncbi:MAG: type II toxin-antitoxin system RelE/ParE family toxin [Fimbriimonadaceae bacterium]|nr:type II toxin-antitoxin system RelE/ParE family toxin [Chitinophagales bacterium]